MIPQHNYHLVDPSPWPVLSSISLLYITVGLAGVMHFFINAVTLFQLGFVLLILILGCWWRDVIRESTFTFHHTAEVAKGLRFGMLLFIISEILFFAAFFWAFFHSSLAPTHTLGCVWPPAGIVTFSPFQIPLLNTCLLLSSGATITLVHYALINKRDTLLENGFYLTVIFAVFFTVIQVREYLDATFCIADGIYASTFYLATGFHGLHVIIGTIFICVAGFRCAADHFTINHHFGFEAAAWHWHFVDVVWLISYISLYYWGNLI